MSFPGRPFGLPGFAAAVPGATIAGGGPFNPHMPGGVFVPATQVGLIPAPPGVIRTTAPIQIRSTPPVQISSKPPENNEEKKDGPEAPKTTVFVGNISEKAPDVLVRQLLAKCGVVLNWKRVQGASGNLQAFGFCEYKEPEHTLRAIRLLHDLTLGDKNLLVKVDAKTRDLLDTYLSEKNKLKGKEDDKTSSEEEIDEITKKEDERIEIEMNKLIIDYKAALNKPPRTWGRTPGYSAASGEGGRDEEKSAKKLLKKPKEQRDEKIDDLEMEDDKKQIISREIDRFRLTHKDETDRDSSKERDGEKESRRSRDRERHKERDSDRERTRDKDRDRDRDRERDRDRDRDRERERERERERRKERERREQEERERERERLRREREKRERAEEERERERESRRRERERERDRDREREKMDDDEDEHERRKLERKLREKEEAYQARLNNWVTRERKKMRDYDKFKDKEKNDKIEMDKDKRSLHDFLEDYDDDKQDIKYYKGAALEKRREDREKEIEADMRDRRREAEEIHEIKRRLKEEGSENLEEELARLEQERDGHKQRRLENVDLAKLLSQAKEQPKEEVVEVEDEGQIEDAPEEAEEEERRMEEEPEEEEEEKPPPQSVNLKPAFEEVQETVQDHIAEPEVDAPKETKRGMGFGGLKLGSSSSPTVASNGKSKRKKKLTVQQVFNQDEDGGDAGPKRRKLVPIEYSEEEMKAVSGVNKESKVVTNVAEEKRKSIKSLIEKIPTEKSELFAYQLDWSVVDSNLMERRIRPWINKKIVEYIGEEEPTLTDFICTKLLEHSGPESILNDITMVLDEEAEVFVVKMWRLLIYEVEAKKHGLVK